MPKIKEMKHMEYGSYQQPREPGRGKQKTSIGLAVFVCCIVLTTVIGLFGGLMLARNNDASQSAALPQSTAAATAVPAGDSTAVSTGDTDGQLQTYRNTEMTSSGAYTRAQIVEMCAPSVVGIDVTVDATGYGFGGLSTYEATGSGSGVILTADGYIATCAHVVDSAKSITVTLNDDTSYEATLVGADARNDLAIIKIDAADLTAAVFGDSDMLTVGEDVIAIGNPLGELRGTATSGIVSAVSRTLTVENTQMTLVQTDAAISPGNSGGGLFDSNGCLIGIVNAKVSDEDAEGLGFAIPVNSVVSEINDLLNYGYITGRAALGVYTQNVTMRSDYGFMFNQQSTYCVQVTDVIAQSAAEKAGIETGDLILAVDDTEISSNTDLSAAIAAYNAGDTATITLQRSGQRITVTVTFEEYKPTDS